MPLPIAVQPVPAGQRARWDGPVVVPLQWLIATYQRYISPLLAPACRFEPTCSHYAMAALREHSAPRALGLIVWRILRCQPLCRGGWDPVPMRRLSDSATACSCLSRPAPPAQETHP